MRRIILPTLAFALGAAIAVWAMPGRAADFKDSDWLVIGSLATLMALLTLFFASRKPGETFFKRRKRPTK